MEQHTQLRHHCTHLQHHQGQMTTADADAIANIQLTQTANGETKQDHKSLKAIMTIVVEADNRIKAETQWLNTVQ